MGLVPPEPGFLELLRDGARAAGALLVFDEVITGFRVGLGGAQAALRHPPRPLDLRQGARRRPPARRRRRPGGAPRRARAARPRVPGGHALGEPARHRGRTRGPRRAVRRRLRGDRSAAPTRSPRGLAAALDRRRPRGHRAAAPSRWPGSSSRSSPCATTTTRAPPTPTRYAALLPRHARPRRVLRAQRLRGDVPEPRAHRRRHRAHHRVGRRGRGRARRPATSAASCRRAPTDRLRMRSMKKQRAPDHRHEHDEQHEGETTLAVLTAGVDELLCEHDGHGSSILRRWPARGRDPAWWTWRRRRPRSRCRRCALRSFSYQWSISRPSMKSMHGARERDDRREPHVAEVELEHHEPVVRSASSASRRRRTPGVSGATPNDCGVRRHATELHDRVPRRVRELEVEPARLRAPDLVRGDDEVVGDEVVERELVVLGRERLDRVARPW